MRERDRRPAPHLHEGRTFDQDRVEPYTLRELTDLAGVRVLVFPRNHVVQANLELRGRFPLWTPDPVREYHEGPILAETYFGYCDASEIIKGEIQIAPMLTGLFWEVEHAAIYKPSPRLVDLVRRPVMQLRVSEVLRSLEALEEEFEKLIRVDRLGEQ
jgi:hypothetical protein